MAIAKVQYKENASATPQVWMDTTQKTVTAGSMLSGVTALKNDGTGVTGNIASKSSSDLTASGATVTAPAGYYAEDANASVASGTAGIPVATKGTVSNNSVSITPTVINTAGYITGGGKMGLSVTVSASELVSGTKTISSSGTTDVTNYATASVAAGSATTPATSITANPTISVNVSGLITASVSGSKSVTPTVSAGYVTSGTAGTVSVSGSNTEQLSTQAGTTITPTENEQTAVASGKYTTGAVKVGAISSTYVGSGITQRDSTDLTASGATVTAPAGYYAEAASTSVASGSAGSPTATKGTVSNHSISVTPSVTNTTGYITGGTKNGTAVTVNVAELESGTKTITENGTGISVSGYSAVDVDVPGQTPTGVKYVYTDIDGVNAYNVAGFEKVSVNYAGLLDGKFRLWVETTEQDVAFSFSVNTSGMVYCNADWGDGTSEDFVSAGSSAASTVGVGYSRTISHTYVAPGRYCAVVSSTGNLIGGITCENNSYLKGVEIASYIDKWYSTNSFGGCANLESITFPENNTDITTMPRFATCNNLPSLKRVVFNSSSSSIPSFENDVSLEELTLPATIGVIANRTFYGCTMLRRINGFDSASITSLNQDMFRNCSSLLSVTIPQSVTTFYNSAFSGSAIKSITIPQSVTDLGRYTFQDCTYLKEVHLLPTTPPTIYASRGTINDPFLNTHPDLVLYVPQGYLSAYQSATNWASFSSIMQEE